jgi:hypothetical protein
VVERPLELGDGGTGIDQGDVRGGEDALLVGESPVLVHPPVERLEGGHQRRLVIDQRLFHPDTECREEDGGFEALLVHDTEPGVAIAVLGTRADRLELAEQLGRVRAHRVAATEVLVEGSRPGDRVEGRIGDEAVDLAADQQPLAAIDRSPLHAPLAEGGIEVAGESVDRLVEVVVGVKAEKVKVHNHNPPMRRYDG